MKEYWISKGSSCFCDELVRDFETDTYMKHEPDGFYDLVSTKNTIKNAIHVVDYESYVKLERKLETVIEALKKMEEPE